MNALIASINIPDGTTKTLTLKNIDFGKSVLYLKQEISKLTYVKYDEIEILFNGILLEDDLALSSTVKPNGYIYCYRKTKGYVPDEVKTPSDDEKNRVQELFSLTSHVQINVNSRVNILQSILQKYPEFRFNMGAHALIRDSVLFNTVHLPEVIDNLAKHYPIICTAAPFIVDTIKKELKKSSASVNVSEPNTDTTSEDENSLGASSNNERNVSDANSGESARPSQVSRQQLQSALAFALSASSQRNHDGGSATNTSSESISPMLLRSQWQRAIENFGRPTDMETDTSLTVNEPRQEPSAFVDGTGDVIPAHYRSHQFAEQLRTMAQMGFLNYEENLTYLNIANGNIEHAVNLLMGIMN